MKKMLMLAASLAIASTGMSLYVWSTTKQTPTTQQLFKDYYHQKCEKSLLTLQKKFNIPDQYLNALHEKIAKLKTADPLFTTSTPSPTKRVWSHPKHRLTQKLTRLALEYELNPQLLNITITNDPKSTEAAFTRQLVNNTTGEVISSVIMNQATLNDFSDVEQEAVLRHELQHILHYDAIEEAYVWDILGKLGYQRSEWENDSCMIEYAQLKELRADQLAATTGGLSIANAIAYNLSHSECPDETNCHPPASKRIAHMKVVINRLQQETKLA